MVSPCPDSTAERTARSKSNGQSLLWSPPRTEETQNPSIRRRGPVQTDVLGTDKQGSRWTLTPQWALSNRFQTRENSRASLGGFKSCSFPRFSRPIFGCGESSQKSIFVFSIHLGRCIQKNFPSKIVFPVRIVSPVPSPPTTVRSSTIPHTPPPVPPGLADSTPHIKGPLASCPNRRGTPRQTQLPIIRQTLRPLPRHLVQSRHLSNAG